MNDQIVFIGTFGIPKGGFEEWKTASREMADFVMAHVPRLISFNFYLNEDGTEGTVIQVHPDSESLEYHMEVAASRIQTGSQMVQVRRIEMYGKPSDRVIERLQRQSSGSWPVIVKTHVHGFSRGEEERTRR